MNVFFSLYIFFVCGEIEKKGKCFFLSFLFTQDRASSNVRNRKEIQNTRFYKMTCMWMLWLAIRSERKLSCIECVDNSIQCSKWAKCKKKNRHRKQQLGWTSFYFNHTISLIHSHVDNGLVLYERNKTRYTTTWTEIDSNHGMG